MALVVRTSKQGGSASIDGGTVALASEVEGDIQALVTSVEAIQNVQIAAGAAIAESKIAANSGTGTTANPGSSDSQTAAASLDVEIHQLRYAAQRLTTGLVAQYLDSSNNVQSAAWQEPPIVGPNLVPNASFDLYDATNTVPFGWSLVGSPTITTQITETSQGEGFQITAVTTSDAQEGISVALEGLKIGKKYLVGAVMDSIVNDAYLKTAGALAAGNAYQDLDPELTTSSASLTTVCGIVEMGGHDLTISVLTDGATATTGDSISVDHVFCYELGDNPAGVKKPWAVEQVISSEEEIVSGGAWAAFPGLSIDAVRASTSDTIHTSVTMPYVPTLASNVGLRIKRDSTVIATVFHANSGGVNDTLSVHKQDRPTVGAKYTYTVEVFASTGDIHASTIVATFQPDTVFSVEVR